MRKPLPEGQFPFYEMVKSPPAGHFQLHIPRAQPIKPGSPQESQTPYSGSGKRSYFPLVN